MRTSYRWQPYYRKRLGAVQVLDYFRTAKRLHRFTGIALTSIYLARDKYGYFYDQGHVTIIEHCSGGKLKGELIPAEAERKTINMAYAKQWRAVEGWRQLKAWRRSIALQRAEYLELSQDISFVNELMEDTEAKPDLLKQCFPTLSAPFLSIIAFYDLSDTDRKNLLSSISRK